MDIEAMNSISEHESEWIALANDLFEHPELSDHEFYAVTALTDCLARYGFSTIIDEDYPTAFRSVWGSGTPVIGFLAEYDALPGLYQPPMPYYNGDPTKSGHGCGHHLLGVGAVAAAVACKESLQQKNHSGTVVLYGCPSEECGGGKIIMARKGAFRELDAAISWHPASNNQTGYFSRSAINSIQFSFAGRTAHAAASPHLGRSALDACELMNVGVNYLREHVTPDIRIHYSYLNAGEKPNIVPEFAATWYYIRGRNRAGVDKVTARVLDIAAGAALMTSTKCTSRFRSRGYESLVNKQFSLLIDQVMHEIGAPRFSEDEKAFACKLTQLNETLELNGQIREDVELMKNEIEYKMSSSDLSDVSQIVPTGHFMAVCAPDKVPVHHWAFTASAGSSIGHKGLLFATKIMAETACRLIENTDLLQKIKQEFEKTATGWVDLNN